MNDGIDLTQFDKMLQNLERLGADMDKIAEELLDIGSQPAIKAFAREMPRSASEKLHASDCVVVSKTRIAKSTKNKFRLVSVQRKGIDFTYLYYVEYGTSKAVAHPFLDKAYKTTRETVTPIMEMALELKINEYLEG